MSTRAKWAAVVCIVLCVAGGVLQTSLHGQDPSPSSGAAAEADPLEVRFAKNAVLLTEARLRQAEEKNRRTPNSISPWELEGLRGNVQLTQEMLASAERGEVQNRNDIFLRYAELAIEMYEQQLTSAIKARSMAPSTYSATDIEVMRLKVEQSKLTLAMGRQAVTQEPEDELRWKVDLLMEEILKIRREIRQLRR